MAKPLRDAEELGMPPVGSLTIREADRALGVDKNAIRRWPADEIPFHVVGPRRDGRYQAEDVADYITARARGERERRDLVAAGRLERIRQEQKMTRALASATRTLASSGNEELARRLRHSRSVISERLDLGDR